MKRIWLMAMVGVAACLYGCASAPSGTTTEKAEPAAETSKAPVQTGETKAKDVVLARVGDTVITDTILEDRINSMSRRRARFKSPKAKKELLNSLVELEVVYQEALKKGLDKDQKTIDRLEEYRRRVVATRLREKVLEDVKVSDREMKGEDFAALAKKYSFDQASAAKGGDIGYANKKKLSPQAYAAAINLKKEGALSDLIEGKGDIRIIKATEVVPESKKPLEEVKSWLERMAKSKKQRETWQNYMDKLKKKGGVEVYEDKIVAVDVSSPDEKK
ncbi:MAG: peptidylprolyl isomerase [bacterium]